MAAFDAMARCMCGVAGWRQKQCSAVDAKHPNGTRARCEIAGVYARDTRRLIGVRPGEVARCKCGWSSQLSRATEYVTWRHKNSTNCHTIHSEVATSECPHPNTDCCSTDALCRKQERVSVVLDHSEALSQVFSQSVYITGRLMMQPDTGSGTPIERMPPRH